MRSPILPRSRHRPRIRVPFDRQSRMDKRRHRARGRSAHEEAQSVLIRRIHGDSLNVTAALSPLNLRRAVFLHFMRSPLDTILSGFVYHLNASEKWLGVPIRDALYGHARITNGALYRDLVHRRSVDEDALFAKYTHSTRRVLACFALQRDVRHLSVDLNVTMAPHRSVRRFYASRSTKDGLFWETLRYFNCEWPASWLMHAIGSAYVAHYQRFELAQFATHRGFDDSVRRLMDALNVVDSAENRKRLSAHEGTEIDMDIAAEREALFVAFKSEDISGRTRSVKHATKGTYDRDAYVELLLRGIDVSVCELIKNMTVLLAFEWNYDLYC